MSLKDKLRKLEEALKTLGYNDINNVVDMSTQSDWLGIHVESNCRLYHYWIDSCIHL